MPAEKHPEKFHGTGPFDKETGAQVSTDVIEFNNRFGDPETQAVLPRLDTDLYDIFEAVTENRLAEIDIGTTACDKASPSSDQPLSTTKYESSAHTPPIKPLTRIAFTMYSY